MVSRTNCYLRSLRALWNITCQRQRLLSLVTLELCPEQVRGLRRETRPDITITTQLDSDDLLILYPYCQVTVRYSN